MIKDVRGKEQPIQQVFSHRPTEAEKTAVAKASMVYLANRKYEIYRYT